MSNRIAEIEARFEKLNSLPAYEDPMYLSSDISYLLAVIKHQREALEEIEQYHKGNHPEWMPEGEGMVRIARAALSWEPEGE